MPVISRNKDTVQAFMGLAAAAHFVIAYHRDHLHYFIIIPGALIQHGRYIDKRDKECQERIAQQIPPVAGIEC